MTPLTDTWRRLLLRRWLFRRPSPFPPLTRPRPHLIGLHMDAASNRSALR